MNPKQPKRLRPSIKKDPIRPADFRQFRLLTACEDCVHFDHSLESCTIGYTSSPHRKAEQLRQYELSGNMALCRFMEVD